MGRNRRTADRAASNPRSLSGLLPFLRPYRARIALALLFEKPSGTAVLDAELLKDVDVEMLQDLIVAAVNEAIETSQAHAASRLQGLTGGLGLPGL